MIHLICYADEKFAASQNRLIASTKHFGIEQITAFTRADIVKSNFYLKNRKILNCVRGGGFWLWKPYIIAQQLSLLNEGDLLLYLDSGVEIISDLSPLLNLCNTQKNIVLFSNYPWINRQWTKRDCFVLMNCDSSKFWNAEQISAGYQLYCKNEQSTAFVQEYLDFCQNYHALSDAPSICGLPNLPEFIDHRHDQSVLSLLAVKHDIELFRDPSQYGVNFCSRFTNSPYDTLFNLHRNKQNLVFWKRWKATMQEYITKAICK